MTYQIAIVEDNELILNMVRLKLEQMDFSVLGFTSAEDYLRNFKTNSFDIIILDIMLPGISGKELLKTIRKRGDSTPVLMLTVKSDISTKIEALDSGADDYLIKPFNLDELLARINALIRRSQGKRQLPSNKVLVINGFKVDTSNRMCESNQGKVVLSEKEIGLLVFLTEHSGETISRADILEEIWGMDVVPTPRTIDNFILKFRKLFETTPENPKIFIAVRGEGYRFQT